MNLDMDTLIESGWSLIETQKQAMEKHGDIPMIFTIFGANGEIDVMIAEQPGIINSPEAKHAVVEEVCRRVAAIQGGVVFATFDSFMAKFKGKAADKLADLVEEIGTAEAERRGLVKRREAISCQITTPLWSTTLVCYYVRVRKLILWEERETIKNSVDKGRMSDYFRYVQQGKA